MSLPTSFRRRRRSRNGLILLVVLSSLAFFSVLIASYLVFSNQAQATSQALAVRNIRTPDHNSLLNDAFMTLLRSTSDTNHPLFGQSLLDDYVGGDSLEFIVQTANIPPAPPPPALLDNPAPMRLGGGLVSVPVVRNSGSPPTRIGRQIDGLYSGRIITFLEGPLANRSYRVMYSRYQPANGNIAQCDYLYFQLRSNDQSTSATESAFQGLFYETITSTPPPASSTLLTDGFRFQMRGGVRSSRGTGLAGDSIDQTVANVGALRQRNPDPGQPASSSVGFTDLPVALQPNQLAHAVSSSIDHSAVGGDFDESYDAADFNNWWLSYTDDAGNVIPSFHRPAVLNYILNQATWTASSSFADLVASLARGTFRPFPIAAGQFGGTSPAINGNFTGGNTSFALRTPLFLSGTSALARLDQLARALITGPWDVDNDGDGTPDSIWIDAGLPLVTSREGKLLRPMIAAKIEDLGARLNINAIGNLTLHAIERGGMSSGNALWAGTRGPLIPAMPPANPNIRNVFQGLGYGPAEITIPMTSSSGLITNNNIRSELNNIINNRYRYGDRAAATWNAPGRDDADQLDVVLRGYMPAFHTASGGYGYSQDPFGRGGIGLGRSGSLLAAGSGVATVASDGTSTVGNETDNDPYELDPTGRLSGDLLFKLSHLESLLRSQQFDSELLSTELRDQLSDLLETHPEFLNLLTTISSSDDTLPTFPGGSSALDGIVDLFDGIDTSGTLTNDQIRRLVAPEFRLGRKLDVNRALGNGFDDNSNLVIDEPSETLRIDSNNDNNVDDTELAMVETQAFGATSGTLPTEFTGVAPNYLFDDIPATQTALGQVTGRQLLARHLYVLMMALTETGYDFPSISAAPPASFDADRFRARRLAQWAVNVVDYRDPDSIRTRFVFDYTPFNGWSPPADPAPSDNVVWGVESPNLMFSESLALHDVRGVDTDRDNGDADWTARHPNAGGDNDTDSVRIPQGSLLLELYCPRPPISGDEATKPGIPRELYSVDGAGVVRLQLDALAPAPAGAAAGTRGAPVYRIGITEPHYAGSGNEALDPENLRQNLPDSASFDPAAPDELDAGAASLDFDRFVIFPNFQNADTNPDAAFNEINAMLTGNGITDMTATQVFFPPLLGDNGLRDNTDLNTQRGLLPGQFLTLAPRRQTFLGSKTFGGVSPGVSSAQRFQIDTTQGVNQYRHDGTKITPDLGGAGTAHAAALPLVIGAPRPSGWALPTAPNWYTAERVIGLNVSEPLPRTANYYPAPTNRFNGTLDQDGDGAEDYPLTDAYIDFTDAATNALDEPLDISRNRIPVNGNEPQLGTIPRYCSAVLQRLADPTRAYHPVYNPYLTIDWIPIDLTVFSGEAPGSDISGGGDNYARRSRQRNGHVRDLNAGGLTAPRAAGALFSYETDFDEGAGANPGNALEDFFELDGALPHIHSSMSFLNTDTPIVNPGFVGFASSIGSEGAGAANVLEMEKNLPTTPYARHPWLNRPFATHYELMMVPACSSGRLFEEFSTISTAAGNPNIFPDSTPGDVSRFNGPMRHLLNFFNSSKDEGATDDDSAQFARLFDFVHTLPRFRGEIEVMNPNRIGNFTANGSSRTTQNELALLRGLFGSPFNFNYDGQRQGRVSINTLSGFPVWAGLMKGHMNQEEFEQRQGDAAAQQSQLSFDNFLESRRGYTVNPTAPLERVTSGSRPYNYAPGLLNENSPTQFAGVFKPAMDAILAPELRNLTAPNSLPQDALRRRSANSTLLRGTGTVTAQEGTGGGGPTDIAMFVRSSTEQPLDLHRNRNRSAFMRYQTLMRMPNLVADNSQVFVVWITMGYFEVDPNNTRNVGREYKADLGENERYKAMFIIDRSRPVGFIRGENLNSRDVVLYESYDQ